MAQHKKTRRRNTSLVAIHPGEMLREEYMKPAAVTAEHLASAIGTFVVLELLREHEPMTADLALRLSKYFGNSAEQWMNMQVNYDLRHAANARSTQAGLARIKPLSSCSHKDK